MRLLTRRVDQQRPSGRHRSPAERGPQRRAAAGSPPPPVGKDYVEGMVQSNSNGTVALRTRSGSATVDYTPQTRVVDVTPAKLSDVTPGSCVNVKATPQSAPPPGLQRPAARSPRKP